MLTRRHFGALTAAPLFAAKSAPRVAAIVTEYRHYSHADVVVGRLLGGNSANGQWHAPRTKVVSLYTDQVPANDMSRDLAARHGFRIYPTIREALCEGGNKLSVDAIVFIGEHGNYPTNDIGQHLYPRYELFNQILDVIESSNRPVPLFSDKHLSYSWEKAKAMYDRAKKLKVPFMAGSSIPVTIREPMLKYPLGIKLQEALALGYGGTDAYGFHTLEVLQCMAERRGETGVASVQMLEGPAALSQDPLLKAAIERCPSNTKLPIEKAKDPVKFVINYSDGLKGSVYLLNGIVTDWAFAAKTATGTDSTCFGLTNQTRPLPHFDGLLSCIEEFFCTGKATHPVERTLLTTGMLAAAFDSKRQNHQLIQTPHLAIKYEAPRNPLVQTA